MGKRSNFARRPMDLYATPHRPVTFLLPFIKDIETYAEPCCGMGDLISHLNCYGKACVWASDVRNWHGGPSIDAMTIGHEAFDYCDAIITNPPWTFQIMEPLLFHLLHFKPVWFLLSGDFAFNVQSARSMDLCTDIVAVGRVRWQPGSRSVGKDNAAWYRFQAGHKGGPRFHPRAYEPDLVELMEEAA